MNTNELVIYYGMVATKIHNKYYLNGAFGRYVDELSKYYEHIYLVLPTITKDECDKTDYCLTSERIVMQELPYYDGVVDALRKKREITDAIRKYSSYWDSTVYIRWPTPFFKLVTAIANRKCLPVCYHLVGDSELVVKTGTKYKGILRMLAIAYAKYTASQVKRIIKSTPTLVNGNGLRRLYSNSNQYIKEIRTSTFYKNEIVQKEPRDIGKCINLLYVGYLRHEKGIEYLIRAIDLIKHSNVVCKLTIIGDGEKRKELEDLVHALHLNECIEFLGYIPVGDALFAEYTKADVFVLPSISEGTPRVLLEAMSHGVAVVATETGGIPFTVQDEENGLLVPIKSAEKIAEALIRLRDNKELYLNIIKNGYASAHENTIEHHVKDVYQFIQDLCVGKKKIDCTENEGRWKRFFLYSIPIRLIQVLVGLLPNSDPANRIRGFLMRPFFKSAGKNLQIAPGVIANRIEQICVGDNVYLSHNAWINGTGKVYIEDGVIVGPFCVIASTEHPFIDGAVSNSGTIVAPVRIGAGSWLASHSVITLGANVGLGNLICANAVVNSDTEDYSMYGGVPAKKIKEMGNRNASTT